MRAARAELQSSPVWCSPCPIVSLPPAEYGAENPTPGPSPIDRGLPPTPEPDPLASPVGPIRRELNNEGGRSAEGNRRGGARGGASRGASPAGRAASSPP